jgi:hypothetical protein
MCLPPYAILTHVANVLNGDQCFNFCKRKSSFIWKHECTFLNSFLKKRLFILCYFERMPEDFFWKSWLVDPLFKFHCRTLHLHSTKRRRYQKQRIKKSFLKTKSYVKYSLSQTSLTLVVVPLSPKYSFILCSVLFCNN